MYLVPSVHPRTIGAGDMPSTSRRCQQLSVGDRFNMTNALLSKQKLAMTDLRPLYGLPNYHRALPVTQ